MEAQKKLNRIVILCMVAMLNIVLAMIFKLNAGIIGIIYFCLIALCATIKKKTNPFIEIRKPNYKS